MFFFILLCFLILHISLAFCNNFRNGLDFPTVFLGLDAAFLVTETLKQEGGWPDAHLATTLDAIHQCQELRDHTLFLRS